MKNSNDPIGNRTRDLPACNAVPQPTEPPRVSFIGHYAVHIDRVTDFSVELAFPIFRVVCKSTVLALS